MATLCDISSGAIQAKFTEDVTPDAILDDDIVPESKLE
jgi:hypothetical protein